MSSQGEVQAKRNEEKTATEIKLICKQSWDSIISASAAMNDCQLKKTKRSFIIIMCTGVFHILLCYRPNLKFQCLIALSQLTQNNKSIE